LDQTLTSPSGIFSFEVGNSREQGWLQASAGDNRERRGAIDPSVSGALGGGGFGAGEFSRVDLNGCRIEAAKLPGVVSNTISLSTRSLFESSDVGVIVMRDVSATISTTVSVTTLSAPSGARKAYEKAKESLVKSRGDHKEATSSLKEAVEIYPRFAAAWDLMGHVYLLDGDPVEAKRCFVRAIAEDPKYTSPLLGLVQIEVPAQNWSEVVNLTERLLGLNANLVPALFFNGLAHFNLGEDGAARGSFLSVADRGHHLDFPRAFLYLGILHSRNREYPEAARSLSRYLEIAKDKVPENERQQIEDQLAKWRSQGMVGDESGG